jgi:pimeloyl-ACP methyl ester carboxylesterase
VRGAGFARAAGIGVLALALAASAQDRTHPASDPASATHPAIDPAIAVRIRALDCAHVSAADVRDALSRAPAPRIVLLQGSVPLVTMAPFARFLIAMGYPANRLRNPRDGAFSYSSFIDSARLAGELAFDYEKSGMEPMLIGHSQGGMLALRTLYELAGAFHDSLHVVDPATGNALTRTSIVDPHSGESRPVVGLRVAYAAALATGWLPRMLLGQWAMLPRLRKIPDSVDEFTGFILPHDPIAGNVFGDTPYESLGRAHVRNVMLPESYHHLTLPRTEHLAADPAMRSWIDAWSPEHATASPDGDTSNLVHAADIWYSVKRHWCAQAQGLLVGPAS